MKQPRSLRFIRPNCRETDQPDKCSGQLLTYNYFCCCFAAFPVAVVAAIGDDDDHDDADSEDDVDDVVAKEHKVLVSRSLLGCGTYYRLSGNINGRL